MEEQFIDMSQHAQLGILQACTVMASEQGKSYQAEKRCREGERERERGGGMDGEGEINAHTHEG